MRRRINVDSGRPLESKAQYSRALRVNQLVLQSGTTAIDLEGNILGESVVEQVNAVFDIAAASMGLAEGDFKNIVRARAYVVGQENLAPAARAIEQRLIGQALVITMIPVSRLARPTQLVEIEFEAIDGASDEAAMLAPATHTDVRLAGLRTEQRLLFSGATAEGSDAQHQARAVTSAIVSMLESENATPGDLVCLRVFVRDRSTARERLADIAESLPGANPVISVMEVPPFHHADTCLMVEAEVYCGAANNKQATPHPQFDHFSAALAVDDQIYLSNIEPLDNELKVAAANDWAAQRDYCIEQLQATLTAVDASLDDVINRRYFTHEHAEQNRGYGDGPAWFESTRPAALGCRIADHLQDGIALTLEAHAVRGAGRDIEWRKL